LRLVPLLGALGVVIGAIAIGTAATSISITIIISIRTTISTAMSAARDKVIGSITPNIVETRLTVTGERQISLEATTGSSPAAVTAPVPELETGRAVELEREIDPAVALELGIVPVAEPVPVIARVAELVLEIVLAEAVREHGLAAVEPEHGLVVVAEHGPVEAALARGHPHGRLAVLLGIKSVIAVHHHGLALVPAAEDLVAVVETTREPAAPEVVAAWEAAA
jgi:hypothetical protein